jgi:hypothetical protein
MEPAGRKKPDRPLPAVDVVDNLEEPMPDGALRRLGSTRFRYPGGNAHAAMSRDGKLAAIGGYGVVLILRHSDLEANPHAGSLRNDERRGPVARDGVLARWKAPRSHRSRW